MQMTANHKDGNVYTGDSHTFVVCAYKESKYLNECVMSLTKQSIKSNVCIATSTPNEMITSIGKKYGIPIYVNIGEKGIAGDWNFACSCAKTPLVTLAHQDDIYDPDYTERVINSVNECKHPLIAFTDYFELRNGLIVKKSALLKVKHILLFPLKMKSMWRSKFVRRRILSIGSAICCPTVTMVVPHLNLPIFKNNMKSNIDWQAWEEISKMDGEFVYVDHPLVKHRIHEESTTAALLEINGRKKEDLYMFCKFWPKPIAHIIDWFYQLNEKSN